MELSNYLAGIWGISLVIIPLAMLTKDGYIRKLFAKIETEENLFCWGIGSFVIGIAMVLAHNVWVNDWRVVITIFGWISLIKGLSMLFMPNQVKAWSKKIESSPLLPFALLVAIFIGLVLTYFSFTK